MRIEKGTDGTERSVTPMEARVFHGDSLSGLLLILSNYANERETDEEVSFEGTVWNIQIDSMPNEDGDWTAVVYEYRG